MQSFFETKNVRELIQLATGIGRGSQTFNFGRMKHVFIFAVAI